MPLFIVSLAFQVLFALHAVRTGRDSRWLYFIILFPLVGCIVYFFAEMLPDLMGTRSAGRARRSLVNAIDPHRELRNSADRLTISNNVDNVVAFAQECTNKGLFDEAIHAYRKALTGIFATDPKLLLGLAWTLFEKSDYPEAVKTLDLLIAENPDFKSADGHLLYARAKEAMHDFDGAREEYEALIQYYPGPEAKYRYAMMLKTRGNEEQVKQLLNDIKITARQSPHHYYRTHKKWIESAKSELARL